MSIASEINRISEQKNIIRDKMRDMGIIEQTASPSIDVLAATLRDSVRIDTGSTARSVLEGDSITIDAGYYKTKVTVSGVTNITADKQKIMPIANPITPTKTPQDYNVPEGYYGFGSFTVKAIPDAYQDTSDADISIVQDSNGIFTSPDVLRPKIVYAKGKRVLGGMPNIGTVDVVLDTSYGVELGGSFAGYLNNEFTIPKGYHDGTGKVRIIVEEKEVTPTELLQIVDGTPPVATQPGKVLGAVKVKPIPSQYKDITEQTITANDVLSTKKFIDKETGEAKYGKIDIYENLQHTLDARNGVQLGGMDAGYFNREYIIPKGYHDGNGIVKIDFDDTQVITPNETTQTVTAPANSGKVLGTVKVKPIPSQYKDLTNQLLEPSQVLKSGRFIDKTTGKLTYGTIENLQEVRGTINTYSQTGFYIEKGGHFDAISIELDNSDLIAKLQEI